MTSCSKSKVRSPHAHDAFRSLAAIANWQIESASDTLRVQNHGLDLINADPVIPTAFRIGAAAAAALGAVGVAAAEAWKLRSGRTQSISVDLAAAAVSCRGTSYLLLDQKKPDGDPWSELTGFYETRDRRWIYLQCNYPHHAERAAEVLGLSNATKSAFTEASRVWDAESLEAAVIESGGCAGIVRSSSEWRAHPQSKAVAALPVLEIVKIGDSPVEPFPNDGNRPLSGVRVLDVSRVLAAPTCGRILTEHGADVLRVSSPHHPNSGLVEIETSLGKLSSFLDLNDASQFSAFVDLLRGTDVMSQSSRPGSLAARRLSPQDAARIRPGIVYISLSAFGHAGPWRTRRGFDSVVQSVSGMAMMSGAGIAPALTPYSAIDYIGGYILAFGAMVALARRAQSGGSYLVRTSLAQIGNWILSLGLIEMPKWQALQPDLPKDVIGALTEERQTVMGRLRHLKPVVGMSETQPRYERGPVPLGYHPPMWPA